MKRFLIHAAILAGFGAVGALAVVFLGLFNVSARDGHLPGVGPVLHETFENSVRLRAPDEGEVPHGLSHPDMIALGARHYDQACRICHSIPQGRQNGTVLSMLPHPPMIEQAVAEWEPRHLFWIVTNGVKMSGMPGWPAPHRKNDVWPVAAFLAQVRTMDRTTYLDLVRPPATEDPLLAQCAMCHGLDGTGRDNREMPRLDILSPAYMTMTLKSYRNRTRESGMMNHVAATLSDEDIARLVDHYGGQRGGSVANDPEPELVAAGEALARGTRDLPACASCHGPGPVRDEARDNPAFPAIQGQRERYIRSQLHAWRKDHRGGEPEAALMTKAASFLTDDQIEALAAYYASLPAE